MKCGYQRGILIFSHWVECAWFFVSMVLMMFTFVGNSKAASVPAPRSAHEHCKIQAISYEGWRAEEISNEWVQVTIVPQLGGRVMQVTFSGHPYLFVNPEFKGKYVPPVKVGEKPTWYNYGGDKIWPMPEGAQDDQHWAGPVADALDDGEYAFRILSQDPNCSVRLEGPREEKTGLQYTRDIRIGSDAPELSFHAVIKNISARDIRWSVQSVTQYDTGDSQNPGAFNHDFWAFAPVHPQSAYLEGFHVRSGLADDPSFSVKNNLFSLHWLYLQNEVWLDSPDGWLAVVDARNGFAMVERFHYQKRAEYPGRATVIFYNHGPSFEMDKDGMSVVSSSNAEDRLHYMEAEINSPMAKLHPSQTYAFDTKWWPTRLEKELQAVRDGGAVESNLAASREMNSAILSGKFVVFVPGNLAARFYDKDSALIRTVPLQKAEPATAVNLRQQIATTKADVRVAVHMIGERGNDRGALAEAVIATMDQEL